MDVKKFVERFRKGKLSLMVVQGGSVVYSSRDGGLSPLIDAIDSGKDCLRDALVIDRVVGRAAALLICYGKSRHVFADLMSETALQVLNAYGLRYEYERLVPRILKEDSRSLCPFEMLVEDVSDPEEGYRLVSKKVRAARSG